MRSAKPGNHLKFYICNFEVNRDRRTRCTNSWSNLTLRCNANTFVKVDTQIEKNCRRTLSYSYQSYCVFSLLFWQKISTKHDITSTEISYQFLALKVLKVPVLRRNKATNSSTSTDPLSAATKALVLGNLFKFEIFAITFARGQIGLQL